VEWRGVWSCNEWAGWWNSVYIILLPIFLNSILPNY
jgi:hypothetical protein